jgi:branched-chain amino acid transport system ATP-binding protein
VSFKKPLWKIIEDLKNHSITMILVEQNTKMALNISQRSYIMNNGRIEFEGQNEMIKTNPELIKKFLGISTDRP